MAINRSASSPVRIITQAAPAAPAAPMGGSRFADRIAKLEALAAAAMPAVATVTASDAGADRLPSFPLIWQPDTIADAESLPVPMAMPSRWPHGRAHHLADGQPAFIGVPGDTPGDLAPLALPVWQRRTMLRQRKPNVVQVALMAWSENNFCGEPLYAGPSMLKGGIAPLSPLFGLFAYFNEAYAQTKYAQVLFMATKLGVASPACIVGALARLSNRFIVLRPQREHADTGVIVPEGMAMVTDWNTFSGRSEVPLINIPSQIRQD